MDSFIRLVGPDHAVEIFGVKLVGVNEANGRKLLFTLAFIVIMVFLARLARVITHALFSRWEGGRIRFWTTQAIDLAAAIGVILGLASIWFDAPGQLASVLGFVTAGLAFALQKVVTAVAGYLVILRGKTFNVGDRIRMGGVRGDVVALGFIQTTIMEMGQPPPNENADSQAWVQSRQYTGRIVTVSNSQIFDEPVYNYTREFPFIWEEMHIPVEFDADHERAEQILLDATRRHTVSISEISADALAELRRRYFVGPEQVQPRVFYRLTSNWIDMTVRFVVREHGIREAKDAISRDILRGFAEAGLNIASSTYDIVGFPPVRLQGNGWSVDGEAVKQNASHK